jgi:hypothetical protein
LVTVGGATIAGPLLAKSEINTLEWLLLEKDGFFSGGKWVVEARRCLNRWTLEFRFLTVQGEGKVDVDLPCMQYGMRLNQLGDGGNLKLESGPSFIRFALKLFPDDPVLQDLKRDRDRQSVGQAGCTPIRAFEIYLKPVFVGKNSPPNLGGHIEDCGDWFRIILTEHLYPKSDSVPGKVIGRCDTLMVRKNPESAHLVGGGCLTFPRVWTCRRKGLSAPDIVALITEHKGQVVVHKAWKFDSTSVSIVPIAPEEVECTPPQYRGRD